MITTKIQVRFAGWRADRARSTPSVRFNPSGVNSKAHAMTSAMGKPITIASTTSRTAQFGMSKNGKTCVGFEYQTFAGLRGDPVGNVVLVHGRRAHRRPAEEALVP